MPTLKLAMSAAVGALLLAAPVAQAQSLMDKGKAEMKDDYSRAKQALSGHSVQLSQVPGPALAAAKKEIGPNITEAKQDTKNGQTIYVLEGRDSANKERSVQVTPDGDVLRSR